MCYYNEFIAGGLTEHGQTDAFLVVIQQKACIVAWNLSISPCSTNSSICNANIRILLYILKKYLCLTNFRTYLQGY